MAQAAQNRFDPVITWSVAAKIAFSVIGALSMLIMGWAAYEIRTMREVVYNSQSRTSVIETRVTSLEKDQDKTVDRVKRLEARVFEEKK